MKCFPDNGQIHDQEGKSLEMESVTTTLQRETQGREITCYLAVNRLQPLQPLPMVNPEETLRSSHPLFSRELWNGQLEIVAEKRSILIPCWNCFFDLLFVAIVIIIIQNGLPQRILPLWLTVKLSAFVQNSVHLWMAERKKLRYCLSEASHSRRCWQN